MGQPWTMRTGGLAHAAHGAPARAAPTQEVLGTTRIRAPWPTGARRRGPVRDSAPLKNGGRWTQVGTDPDAGPAPLGAAGKTAGRRRSRAPRRAAEAVRAHGRSPRAWPSRVRWSCWRTRSTSRASDGRVGGVQRPLAGADRRAGRDRLARRTSTLEKVELLVVGREATEEASGDAEAPTKSMARAGARFLARASPGACLGPARRGRQGRGRGRWPGRPAARGAVVVAPGRRSQGPASSLRRRRRGAHGHGVGRGPGVARRRRIARQGVVLRHCRVRRSLARRGPSRRRCGRIDARLGRGESAPRAARRRGRTPRRRIVKRGVVVADV